jgi:gas vesicle protein
MRKRRTSSILTLLVILILGVLVGMLFSPTRGATTRSLILYNLKRLFEKIKLLFLQLVALPRQVETHNDGKVASQEVINETIRKAKKLLEEAEELSNELDANNPTI